MKFSSIVKFLFFRVINTARSSVSLSVIFVLFLSVPYLFSQDGAFKPSRTEAETAWNIGDYEKAYRHYNALLLLYSRDPSYKYFTGACLVHLERDPSRSVSLLGSAINSSQNVKTVPDDVWFYYGRALQMDGRCIDAIQAFDKFLKYAGKKQAQEYAVQKYIDSCRTLPGTSVLKGDNDVKPAKGDVQNIGIQVNNGDPSAVALNTKPVSDDTQKESPSEDNRKTEIIPDDYDKKLTTAVRLQYEADSLVRVANALRRTSGTVPPEKKQALLLRAASLEKEAAAKMTEADSVLVTLEPEDQRHQNKVELELEVKIEAETENEISRRNDSATLENAEQEAGLSVGNPVFSVFEVRSSPAYSDANPIPSGMESSKGLVYRIQLAAFKNPVPQSHFKGLYPIYGKVRPENGVTYYYAGIFRTIESAREALQRVRTAGFPDAFVTAMMDDIQVSMERALVLEKEWSKKPLMYQKTPSMPVDIKPVTDTIPVGTLYFRAEVMRSKKTVQPDVSEKIQLLAGRRGLDIIKNKQGETIFLVGNFITFESAEDYVSLLVRNGYPSAKVVAYIGAREIAVDTARELLKKLTDD